MINVEQLCHGIDIPDIKTIILARPTSSDILFTQMVGRGSRCRLEGGDIKEEFIVVDFADNFLDENLTKMFTGHERLFKGTSAKGTSKDSVIRIDNTKRESLLDYNPSGELINIGSKSNNLSCIQGFPIRRGQSFGVEIELTSNEFILDDTIEGNEKDKKTFNGFANELIKTIEKVLMSADPVKYKNRVNKKPIADRGSEKNYLKWNVEYDGSCGLEIISPVLVNEEGFEELSIVLRAIEKKMESLRLYTNYSTGLHVHFGWRLPTFFDGFKFLRNVFAIEPALSELLSPSRVMEFIPQLNQYNENKPNEYCVPISYAIPEKLLQTTKNSEPSYESLFLKLSEYTNFKKHVVDPHYLALNFENLWTETGTIEVRYHQSTVEFERVAGWISLWMNLLWKSLDVECCKNLCSKSLLPLPDMKWNSLVTILNEVFQIDKDSPLLKHIDSQVKKSKKNWNSRILLKKSA